MSFPATWPFHPFPLQSWFSWHTHPWPYQMNPIFPPGNLYKSGPTKRDTNGHDPKRPRLPTVTTGISTVYGSTGWWARSRWDKWRRPHFPWHFPCPHEGGPVDPQWCAWPCSHCTSQRCALAFGPLNGSRTWRPETWSRDNIKIYQNINGSVAKPATCSVKWCEMYWKVPNGSRYLKIH